MAPQIEDIKTEIEEALRSLSEQKGDEIVRRIRPILYANLDRGRIQGFIDGEIDRVRDYVWRVADGYVNLSPYITKLQVERATSVWEPLYNQMQIWAYKFFIRKGFSANTTTREIAAECAIEASINVLGAHFPYDTEFERWVHVIVQNACRRFIRKETKKSIVPQQSMISLEDILNTIEDPKFGNQEHQNALKGDLMEAISQLSNARRRVIELKYFDELSFEEIAGVMKKTVGAIHSLHFNALQDLRKILSRNRNNNNE